MKAAVVSHGSICLFEALDDEAQAWVDENVGDENTQTWGAAIVVEPRYIGPLVDGFREAGGELA